jgi:hypothetical protein
MTAQRPVSGGTFLDRLYAKINGGMDQVDARLDRPLSPAEVAAAARRPRESWSLEVAGVHHTLQLKSSRWRWEDRRVFLDGQRISYIRAPGAGASRTEASFNIGDQPIVIALEWRRDWDLNLRIDVFLNGVSLLDGQSLEQARAAAPGRIGQYDARMFRVQRAVRGSLWYGVIVAVQGFAAGCVAGVLVGLASAVWELGLFGGLVVVNSWNLARPTLGAIRWLLLIGYAIGYPAVSLAITMALLVHR